MRHDGLRPISFAFPERDGQTVLTFSAGIGTDLSRIEAHRPRANTARASHDVRALVLGKTPESPKEDRLFREDFHRRD